MRDKVVGALVLACLLAVGGTASAHVERPSYFPDPAADTSVRPAAGGSVPAVRSLRSALDRSARGRTRVVCRQRSMRLVRASVRSARRKGYAVRPSDRRRLSRAAGRRLLRVNRALRKRCAFRHIQPAVTASRNNDRVVVMPGLYTEPRSRAKPTNDPACAELRTNGDRPGEEGTALSYAYQAACPNDQNLIAVIGRRVGSGTDPVPPRHDRFGIPNLGACRRCNLQVEGSGVSADDVVIEAGDASKGDGGPNGAGSAKDVAIRADRADGFVLRKVTVRHAKEHGVYVIETDGYVLEHFKARYGGLYGTLTFTSDHGRQQDCEATGHGDSGVYPGGAPDTGAQRPAGTGFRYNQLIRRCDLHHNMAGFSGTSGNALRVRNNRIYDNVLGITTDAVTGAGHPGYPGDSALFERNRIFSNNFDIYADDSDVAAAFPFPIGTGLWIAGGNHHQVRRNWIYDNWRRGTMVFSVPDALICGPAADGNEQAGCDSNEVSTSHYNAHYENRMGVRPDGRSDPNGTDFWWDDFPGARGNCWYANGKVTTSPEPLPGCDRGQDPATSLGKGNSENQAELISCVAAFETRDFENSSCPWLTKPPEPSGGARSTAFEPAFAPVTRAASIEAQRGPDAYPVPLGQATCTDWLATAPGDRSRLVSRITAFAGGVVNTGQEDLGTGATLAFDEASRLFDDRCATYGARGFLLYKLYTGAAAFTRHG